MAESKPIKYSDIAEPNLLTPLIKQLNEVNKLLIQNTDALKGMMSVSADLAKNTPLDSYENLAIVEKGLKDTVKAAKELDKVEKDRAKLEERIKQLQDERQKGLFELRELIRQETKQLRDNARAQVESGDAYKVLTKRTSEAQAEFKRLAAEFGVNSEQAKEARRNFERLDSELREVNDAAKDGRRDVGRYEKGVKSLNRAFSAFASATIVLKILDLLQGAFSQNSDGVAFFQKIWVRFTTVLQVTVDRLVNIFPILGARFEQFVLSVQIKFKELTSSLGSNSDEVEELRKQYEALEETASRDLFSTFDGFGKELEEVMKKQVDLIDNTLSFRKEIVGLEKEVANLIPTHEKLRSQFEDDSTSLEEQIKAGVAFRKSLQERFKIEEKIANKRLSLARQNASANSSNVEAQEELSAALLEYNQLVADQANEIASTDKAIQKLRDDAVQLNLDFYLDDYDNRKTVNERIIADESQTFERRRQLLNDNLADAEKTFQLEADAINKSLADRGKAQLDFDELRKKSSSEEIARIIRDSGLTGDLAKRALEILRERRTVLQDNAESQRDLNEAEQESRDIQNDIILQEEALLKLQEQGVDVEKILQSLQDARLQSEIDELQMRLQLAKKGTPLFLKINQELNDKLLEQTQQRIAKEEKAAEDARLEQAKKEEDARLEQAKKEEARLEQAKKIEEGIGLLADLARKRSQQRIDQIDEEISREQERVNQLKELAAQGNEDAQNNLAITEQRQAELELQREQQLKRQKQSELALTAIQTYSAKASNGDPNPLSSTIADISVLRAFISSLPGFFHGTEDTGNTGVLSDQYGKITGFTHENERVLNASQNKLIGDISNAELTRIAVDYGKGYNVNINLNPLLTEFRQLKQVIQQKPEYMGSDYNTVTEMLTHRIKKGKKIENRSTRKGGIWS